MLGMEPRALRVLDKPSPESHLNLKIVLSMISVEYCWLASDVKVLVVAYEFFCRLQASSEGDGPLSVEPQSTLFYNTGTLISLSLKLHNTSL